MNLTAYTEAACEYMTGQEVRRALGLKSNYQVTKLAAMGKIRTLVLPARPLVYLREDVVKLAAEAEARATAK